MCPHCSPCAAASSLSSALLGLQLCLASNLAPAVDIALPEERIAIEVDGPHHFTSNTFRPLGEMYCRWVAFQPGQASQMIGRIWREGGYGWVGQDGMAG